MHHTDTQFQEEEIHKNHTNSKNLKMQSKRQEASTNLEAFEKDCMKSPGRLLVTYQKGIKSVQ